MLLTHPRLAFLNFCLAGMEAAAMTPFVALLWAGLGVWQAFALLLAALIAWSLTLDLLGRTALDSPRFEIVTVALMAATGLLAIRLVLYAGRPLGDLPWFSRVVRDTLDFRGGLPPPLLLFAANFLLWQRATAATSRNLSFFSVGVSFRLGMLILFFGGGIYARFRGGAVLGLLFLYFALGLMAVSFARILEKSTEAQSSGAPLPLRRVAQVLAAAALTVGASALVSRVYTAEGIGRAARFVFDPIWNLVGPVLLTLGVLLARLVNPLLLWFESALVEMLARRGAPVDTSALPAATGESGPQLEGLPVWASQLLGQGIAALGILVALLVLLVFLVLYLEKTRRQRVHGEAEEEGEEAVSFGGGIFGRAVASARALAGLVRRYGWGRDLLAAISVQNLYANVCRLARLRGYPRPRSVPPDGYLPTLARAFAGDEARLARLTAAYMQVHYGDHPVGATELVALREDYRALLRGE